jgi:hypothetical protein
MTISINVQPIDEQNFLKRNALLSLSLGFFFSIDMMSILLTPTFKQYSWLELAATIVGTVLAITLVVMSFKTLFIARKISQDTFYCGNFQDEYLNHVNAKGYKYGFNFVALFLLSVYYISGFSHMWIDEVSLLINTREFAKFTAGLVFISYAIPVLYMLNSDDADE